MPKTALFWRNVPLKKLRHLATPTNNQIRDQLRIWEVNTVVLSDGCHLLKNSVYQKCVNHKLKRTIFRKCLNFLNARPWACLRSTMFTFTCLRRVLNREKWRSYAVLKVRRKMPLSTVINMCIMAAMRTCFLFLGQNTVKLSFLWRYCYRYYFLQLILILIFLLY